MEPLRSVSASTTAKLKQEEQEVEKNERSFPLVGATQQEQTTLDAEVGGYDRRRARVVVQVTD